MSDSYFALAWWFRRYRPLFYKRIGKKTEIWRFGEIIWIIYMQRVFVTACMSCEASLERVGFMQVFVLTKIEFQLYFLDSTRVRHNLEQTTAK